jgi:translation initiation factor IF-1
MVGNFSNNRGGGGGGARPGGGAPGGFKKPGMHNNPNKNKNRGRGGSKGGGGFLGGPRRFEDPNSEENILRREKSGVKRGRVVEALPNAMFRVEYEDGTKGLGMIGGKLKVFKIRIMVGDMVEAVIDPYSKKGRIIKRG